MPRSPKTGRGASKYVKAKRATKKDAMRLYGLPESYKSNNLRYQNPIEKGIYWYKFSLFIRNRDVKKYGTCISCGRPITVETCDAGHFAPAADCGLDLLFDPVNVNAECSHCNAWDGMHLFGYEKGLDERYGAGTAELLKTKRDCYKKRIHYPDGTIPTTKAWKADYYKELLVALEQPNI